MRLLKNKGQVWVARNWGVLAILLGVMAGSSLLHGQEKRVGEVADDFELTNVLTGEPVRLSDLGGSVVVLDFFFYW